MTMNGSAARARPVIGARMSRLVSGSGLLIAYIALAIFVAVADSKFFSWSNVENMLVQNTGLALVVVGMTYVIIGGSYDLSVGGIAGLSGVIFAKISLHGSILGGALVALLAGLLCGLINAVVVAVLKVNSFMATFATGLAFAGFGLQWQGSRQIVVFDDDFGRLGLAKWGPIPEPIVLTVLGFAVGGFVLHRSRFGQNVYAVGGNREAARLVGIPVARTWGATFVVSGLMAAFGGLIIASQLGLGSSSSGQSLPIESIAAVVVGGVSVYGGEGRMGRAALGLLILATLNNVFIGLSWSVESQNVAEGVVILLALAANRIVRARRHVVSVGPPDDADPSAGELAVAGLGDPNAAGEAR
jgi:ribose/xylose/arabinose/galactoside ABC-type transport system permease subunit